MSRFITETGVEFCQLSFREVEQLEAGEKIVILTCFDPPRKMEFCNAEVVRPLFWNSDADEPGYEVETTNGFVDVNSIYRVIE